eukprot:887646-Pelagomonas_calceolata.AAC.1
MAERDRVMPRKRSSRPAGKPAHQGHGREGQGGAQEVEQPACEQERVVVQQCKLARYHAQVVVWQCKHARIIMYRWSSGNANLQVIMYSWSPTNANMHDILYTKWWSGNVDLHQCCY